MLGLVHQGTHPVERQMLRHFGVTDGVTLGFRCGPDHVVQLSMDRYGQSFSDRDLAMLRMITPALQRLLRTSLDALDSRTWGGLHFRDAMSDAYGIGRRTARNVMHAME